MNELTFNILKIVLSAATAIITVVIVPYVREKIKDSKYEKLLEIVEIAVRAAEQTIKGSGNGAVKKDEVVNFVSWWMLEHGIKVSPEQLDQLIEACVFSMNREVE
jgi:LL-H family phage holin